MSNSKAISVILHCIDAAVVLQVFKNVFSSASIELIETVQWIQETWQELATGWIIKYYSGAHAQLQQPHVTEFSQLSASTMPSPHLEVSMKLQISCSPSPTALCSAGKNGDAVHHGACLHTAQNIQCGSTGCMYARVRLVPAHLGRACSTR